MLSSRRAARILIAVVLLATAIPPAAATTGEGTFVDDDRSRFEPYIETAYSAGLAIGCNPPANNLFCPHHPATRGELASLLARSLELPVSETDYYTDDNGHPSEQAINALTASGVAARCGIARFCPDQALTRHEMAWFIATSLDWPLPANTYPYLDLEGSTYGMETKALARRGALEPCDPPVGKRLCPAQIVAREEAVFAVTSALGLEPAGPVMPQVEAPRLGFADAFESLALWDGRVPSSRNRVELTGHGYAGSGLRVTIPKGSHFGADFKLDLSEVVGEEPEILYFRYFLRLDPDWAPRYGGKLPGFSGVYSYTGKGGYQSIPSSPGWSARMEFFATSDQDPRARLGYYVYHLGQEGRYGDGMAWNEAGKLNPGEWYCIEGEVAMNTPGVADGALRAWVDGTPAFDVAGIQFRRPDEPNIRIESFWFNVYYGGKPVPERDHGMVIDEVEVAGTRIGCGAGEGISRVVSADVTGDGFDDRVSWGSCPGGTCFTARAQTPDGTARTLRLGDGGWFSLETSRLGMGVGDLNGDDREDLVYHGRCRLSQRCWRVHRSEGSSFSTAEDWGNSARFTTETESLVVGDWNGDGFDDMAYRGLCGNPGHLCWRVHVNHHNEFVAEDWGLPPSGRFATVPVAADLNADGVDDLLYPAVCGAATCWFGQLSTGTSFASRLNLGLAHPEELQRKALFDFDGDGDEDLIAVRSSEEGNDLVMRRAGPDGLGDSTTVARFDRPVSETELRRVGPGQPVEALITLECDEPPCVQHRLSLSGRLLPAEDYERAVRIPPMRRVGFFPV